jgi:Holliday junction resolvasome RuvABC endonuclease subunit
MDNQTNSLGADYYLGIDPGASGGLAFLQITPHGDLDEAAVYPIGETEHDTASIIAAYSIGCYRIIMAAIEKVHSFPGQGVSSTFKFGQNYGFLRGLLVGRKIPFIEVPPQTWQKALGCLSHGDKNITKARAQQLYPHLKITHKTADALLIARYLYLREKR